MSERIYGWLLHLYPRAFRERYADEMVRVLRDRLDHEAVALVWLDVLLDAAASIPCQHLRSHAFSPRAPRWQDSMPSFAVVLMLTCMLGAAAGFRVQRLGVGSLPPSLIVDGPLVVLVAMTAMRVVVIVRAKSRLRVEATATAVTVMRDDVVLQTLRREDVSRIDQQIRGLRIQSVSAGELFVPLAMQGYAPVRQLLAGWMPIAYRSRLAEWVPIAYRRRLVSASAMGTPLNVSLLYASAILSQMTVSTWFVAVCLIVTALRALRTLPLRMKLLYLGPCIVLLLRWWWLG